MAVKRQVIELTVDSEDNLRATVRPDSSRPETDEVYIDLMRDDEIRGLINKVNDLLFARIKTAPDDNCLKCTGHCCTAGVHFEIGLHEADVVRLAEHLGMSKEKFVKKYIDPMYTTLGYPHQFAFREDKKAEGGWCCPFLEIDKRGAGRCGVYEARPAVCRGFPAHNCEYFVPLDQVAGRFRRNRLPDNGK